METLQTATESIFERFTFVDWAAIATMIIALITLAGVLIKAFLDKSALSKEHNGLSKEHNGLSKEHNGLSKEHDGLSKEHERLSEKQKVLSGEHKELRSAQAEIKESLVKISCSLQAKKELDAKDFSFVTNNQNAINATVASVYQMSMELKEAMKQRAELEKQLLDTRSITTALKERINALEYENREQKESINALQHKLRRFDGRDDR